MLKPKTDRRKALAFVWRGELRMAACERSTAWHPARRLDPAHFGRHQNAQKQPYGQSYAHGKGAEHLAAALCVFGGRAGAAIAFAHHEEQRTAKARQNGEKSENDHEFHEWIIWCELPEFQTSGGFY